MKISPVTISWREWFKPPFLTTLAIGLCTLPAFSGSLHIKVVDIDKKQLPCRILIRPADSGCVVPEGFEVLPIGPDRWILTSGEVQVQVPDGPVEIRIERGLEYKRSKQVLEVKGPQTQETVVLDRWTDMEKLGYASGENHLHVDTVRLAPMLAAEGLDYGTSMTWWNGPGNEWCLPVPPGEGRTRILRSAGQSVETTVHDAEIEYSWGAAYFLNLSQAMPLLSSPGRPNLDYVLHVRRNGGFVFYQAGWSREVAVDALLGLVDGVNVCNNNFHMHRFQPRSHYSNLLEVEGFPIYSNTAEDMMRMNFETYYRLLNWGLRLAAGAGSATGFKEVPVGFNRSYVRVNPGTPIESFYRAWSEGKNFVTNGPLLFLESDSGKRPGDLLTLPESGGTVSLSVRALADMPLESVELVLNGKVVASKRITGAKEASLSAEVKIEQGSWVAARCSAIDDLLSVEELAPYANGDREQPSRLRYAHTSPIYIEVGGKLAAVRSSILEGLQMLERFEIFAANTASEDRVKQIVSSTREARRILEAKLEQSD